MSLDTILEEMDRDRANQILMSNKDRNVSMKLANPPIYQRLGAEPKVCFTSSEFNGSLTKEDINGLFSPLGKRMSLDQVLQGDGLFGPESTGNNKQPQNSRQPQIIVDNSSDEVSVEKRDVCFSLEESLPTDCDHGDSAVELSDELNEFHFKLSTGDEQEAPSVLTTPTIAAMPHSASAEGSCDEDMIDLYPDDVGLFDSDIKGPTPLSKLFKKPPIKAPPIKVPPIKASRVKETTPLLKQCTPLISQPNNGKSTKVYLHSPGPRK